MPCYDPPYDKREAHPENLDRYINCLRDIEAVLGGVGYRGQPLAAEIMGVIDKHFGDKLTE